MNCKPGDLALVVRSSNPENLMKIVEVIKPYDPRDCGIVALDDSRQVWLCESLGSKLAWSDIAGTHTTRAQTGPIPDECLKPICPGQEDETSVTKTKCPAPQSAVAAQHC